MELTQKQIERQDFVDNSIFALLQTLNTTDKLIDWDIEIIAEKWLEMKNVGRRGVEYYFKREF